MVDDRRHSRHSPSAAYDTTRHDTTRHDTTRHDTTRHTPHTHSRHDTTRHDTRTQLGWIVGSLCAGRLYESTGKRSHAVLFGSTMAMAAFLLVFPFARSLWLLLTLQAVNAFFTSFNDVGANTLMFQVWQRQVAPYMQFLHFSYGVGTAPLLYSSLNSKTDRVSCVSCVRLCRVCVVCRAVVCGCVCRGRVDVGPGHHCAGAARGPVRCAAPLVSTTQTTHDTTHTTRHDTTHHTHDTHTTTLW